MRAPVEQALVFDCDGESLVGILTRPEAPSGVGIVIVVGGPQYRIGSHRQFVLLARAFAAAGHSVLRFDYRSMGDASGERRDFLSVEDDLAAAIEALRQRCPAVRRIVLWGLCDGASAALLYVQARTDHGITGLCLLNPWVRSAASLARTQIRHYYLARLSQRSFWSKLFSGKVAAQALRDLAGNLRSARTQPTRAERQATTFQERMAAGWQNYEGSILLLLSEEDYTAKEFIEHVQMAPAWRGALARTCVAQQVLSGTNHTFSNTADRSVVIASTLGWIKQLGP